MKTTKYIVTAVDSDPDGQCDDKARVLGAFDTEEDARIFVNDDIAQYVDFHDTTDGKWLTADYVKMSVHNDDFTKRCEWNIEPLEIYIKDV